MVPNKNNTRLQEMCDFFRSQLFWLILADNAEIPEESREYFFTWEGLIYEIDHEKKEYKEYAGPHELPYIPFKSQYS